MALRPWFIVAVTAPVVPWSIGCLDFARFGACYGSKASACADAHDAAVDVGVDAGDGKIIVSDQNGVIAMARADETLYWATATTVASCPLGGCSAPETVATGEVITSLTALHGRAFWVDFSKTYVYFTQQSGIGSVLLPTPGTWVEASENDVYMIAPGHAPMETQGDPPANTTTFLSFVLDDGRLTARGTAVGWTELATTSVHLCPTVDNPVCDHDKSLVSQGPAPLAIALDTTNLYWSEKNGLIRRVEYSATGFTPQIFEVASEIPEASWIASDESGPFLYVASRGTEAREYKDGAIFKVPRQGGRKTIIASNQARPESVLVIDSYIYWANKYEGTIRRAPK
jgi:hypothetical protein